MRRDFVLYGVIALLSFILFKGCNEEQQGEKIIVNTKTVTKFLPGEPETTFVKVPIYIKEVIPSKEVVINDSINEYVTDFKDSLAEIIITSTVKGKLINSSLEFKPFFPKYIYRTDTFKEVTTNEVIKRRWSLSAGVIFGASAERFQFAPTVLVQTKKSLSLSLGYDVLNKTYNVGLFTKIKRPF